MTSILATYIFLSSSSTANSNLIQASYVTLIEIGLIF